MKRFKFYYDAAHGWLEVTDEDVRQVGLTRNDFSAYSYTYGDKLYLEEDCDATTFVIAYEKIHGKIKTVSLEDGYDSPIRSMPRLKIEHDFDEIPF